MTPEQRRANARIASLARWHRDPDAPPPRRSRPKLTAEQRHAQAAKAAKVRWANSGHVECKARPEPTAEQYREIWATKILPKLRYTERDCWEFTGGKTKGYGTVNAGHSRGRTTHRIAAVVFLGMDMSNSKAVVMHHCDNPPCCNPDHLSVGTHRDNLLDAIAKGIHPGKPPGTRREFCARGHRMAETRERRSDGSSGCGVCRRARRQNRKAQR